MARWLRRPGGAWELIADIGGEGDGPGGPGEGEVPLVEPTGWLSESNIDLGPNAHPAGHVWKGRPMFSGGNRDAAYPVAAVRVAEGTWEPDGFGALWAFSIPFAGVDDDYVYRSQQRTGTGSRVVERWAEGATSTDRAEVPNGTHSFGVVDGVGFMFGPSNSWKADLSNWPAADDDPLPGLTAMGAQPVAVSASGIDPKVCNAGDGLALVNYHPDDPYAVAFFDPATETLAKVGELPVAQLGFYPINAGVFFNAGTLYLAAGNRRLPDGSFDGSSWDVVWWHADTDTGGKWDLQVPAHGQAGITIHNGTLWYFMRNQGGGIWRAVS